MGPLEVVNKRGVTMLRGEDGKLVCQPVLERFFSRITKEDGGCWLWTGSIRKDGYGSMRVNAVKVMAHRLSWEISGRTLVSGMTLDHLCRNRRCVNPDHLEQVTIGENVLRGDTISGNYKRRTKCVHGHEYSQENTRIYRGYRQCLACEKARNAAASAARAMERRRVGLKIKPPKGSRYD